MERDRSLFRHFGLNPEQLYFGTTHERYAQRIQDAVESRLIVSVIGGFGSGKTTLVSAALESLPGVVPVFVNNPDRERLRIGQILSTLIINLSTENPKRDAATREVQLARILGETVVLKKKEVCLIIENAHRLTSELLLALKDLRESLKYRGKGFLFSIILVGQEGLRDKLERYGEVEQRTRPIELDRNGWMCLEDRQDYLRTLYGDVIAPEVSARLASLFTTPLAIDHVVQEKMLMMRDAGLKVLDESVFPLSLPEQVKALRVSLRDIERVSKVPKSTVEDVLKGKNTDPATIQRIQQGINDIALTRAA